MSVRAPVIAGKYTLLRKLGAGGMAEVFLAKQIGEGSFEKLVVIKRILPHLMSGPTNADFVNMFLDEARLASDLRHQNIVTVIDIGKTSDTHYIVMEFLHGQDVRKMQRKNASWGEQIPIGHCCQIAIGAAAGLHYAHNKKDLSGKPLSIVHRDVSPQNIIVTYEGGTKIVDFGIAKAATQSTHTSTGVLKGKYTYMSPEQAAGEVVDARTDQFALGIVLWELLTMRRLFKRDTELMTLEAVMGGTYPRPSRFREDLPKGIDDVVMKALSKKRDERFASCEELALALEDELGRASIVHSTSRLSQYMRRLFADLLAEEATLGLVNPDGSLSKNLTPFTLPPQDQAEPADKLEKPPEKPEKPAQEATTADRKSARSRDDTASKKISEKVGGQAPAPQVEKEEATEPTVVDEPKKPKKYATTQKLERAQARERRPLPWAAMGAGVGAAVLVFVLYFLYAAIASHGPGTLIVRSEPKGAAVTIDGKPTGQTTPALLKDVEAGVPHKVSVSLPGKAPVEEVITIEKRGMTLEVKLDIR